MGEWLILAPACLEAGLQPFDRMLVDDADLSPIVLVPLPVLLPHLGCSAAIESDGLNVGHTHLPLRLFFQAASVLRHHSFIALFARTSPILRPQHTRQTFLRPMEDRQVMREIVAAGRVDVSTDRAVEASCDLADWLGRLIEDINTCA